MLEVHFRVITVKEELVRQYKIIDEKNREWCNCISTQQRATIPNKETPAFRCAETVDMFYNEMLAEMFTAPIDENTTVKMKREFRESFTYDMFELATVRKSK